jgi:hypothetical protein
MNKAFAVKVYKNFIEIMRFPFSALCFAVGATAVLLTSVFLVGKLVWLAGDFWWSPGRENGEFIIFSVGLFIVSALLESVVRAVNQKAEDIVFFIASFFYSTNIVGLSFRGFPKGLEEYIQAFLFTLLIFGFMTFVICLISEKTE